MVQVSPNKTSTVETSVEQLIANKKVCSTYRFVPQTIKPRDKAIIVGAGPSLEYEWEKIKGMSGDIFAIKTVDFLINRNIIPDYSVHYDPKDTELARFAYHPDITYLVSDQCTPGLYSVLYDMKCKVHVVPSRLHPDFHESEFYFAGSNSALATLIYCFKMGYKCVHLFGVDMSFETQTHVDRNSDWYAWKENVIEMYGYKTTTNMWYSCEDIVSNIRKMTPTMCIYTHGDNLLSHVRENIFGLTKRPI